MRRVNPRGLLMALGLSLACATGLLAGAFGHRMAAYVGLPETLAIRHVAVEAFLWAGAVLAVGVFLAAVVGLRREVRAQKRADRRKRERKDLLRAVRTYVMDRNGRMNN